MGSMRMFLALAVAGWIGFAAETSDAALAKKAGGSGLSGQLSSNKAIRKQQLICDPNEPTGGSTSVAYQPGIVSLSGLIFGPGYTGTGVVEVAGDGGNFLQPINQFLVSPAGPETGYAQVFFSEPNIITLAAVVAPLHGQLTPPTGYLTVDKGGPVAVDTHAFFFNYLATVPDRTIATYTVYADTGRRSSGNTPDFMNGFDPQTGAFRVGPGEIAPVTVRGSLNAVPLPPAVLAGGVMLLGMAVVGTKRRRTA